MKKQLMPLVPFAITLTALVFFAGCKGVYTGDDYGFDSDWKEIGIDGNGGGGNGTFAGSITFSDGLPDGWYSWAFYVIPTTITKYADAAYANEGYVAAGSYGIASGNKVVNLLKITIPPGRTFNKNGNYTILILDALDLTYIKYKNSVQFSGGNATIAYSSMTTAYMR